MAKLKKTKVKQGLYLKIALVIFWPFFGIIVISFLFIGFSYGIGYQFSEPLSSIGLSQSPVSIKKASLQTSPAQEKDFCLNVPILLYHHIEPMSLAAKAGHTQLTVDISYFEEQMKYLTEHNYKSLSGLDLAVALAKQSPLPEKSIIITIDDGYKDNYDYAFKILKKYNLTGNFMIPTGLIGKPGYMSWREIKEIADYPLMRIYNHTQNHAALGNLQNKIEIEREITNAEEKLEMVTGFPVNIFAYPYGSSSKEAIEVIAAKGYLAAFSTVEGIRQCGSEIYMLKRLHIGNATLNKYGL